MKVLELFDLIKTTFPATLNFDDIALVYTNGNNESIYVDYFDEGESDYQVETVIVAKFDDRKESNLPEYKIIIQKPTDKTLKMVMDILLNFDYLVYFKR